MKSSLHAAVATVFTCAIAAATPAAAQDAPAKTKPPTETDVNQSGGRPPAEAEQKGAGETVGSFLFGSYGRAQVELDKQGNAGASNNIVTHGPRIFQEDYAEFDFNYTLKQPSGFTSQVLFTMALFGPFAHYDGTFDDRLAVRNLYAQMSHISDALDGLSLWAGSRMYRGDDVYLLDWWPLDELNTIGAGAKYHRGGFDGRVQVGVNRLDNAYQLQVIKVPAKPIGSRSEVLLDRQRLLTSARLEYAVPDLMGAWGAKAVAYGEYHHLPKGQRIPPELMQNGAPVQPPENVLETLPEDSGFVLGAQAGLFQTGTANHLNLFFRLARGLAAYGELGVPYGTAANGTADGAQDLVGALSGNWENHWFGVLAGAYLRRFTDADTNTDSPHEYVEGAAVVRPSVFITDHFQQAVELSYQRRHPFGLDPETGQHHEPAIFQASALELVSLGRGDYTRPQIRLAYTIAFANQAAQNYYPTADARRREPVEHIFSVGAEWWFNSSTY